MVFDGCLLNKVTQNLSGRWFSNICYTIIAGRDVIRSYNLPEHNVGRGNNRQIDSHHEVTGGQMPQVERMLGVRLAASGADHVPPEQDQ